MSSDNNNSDTSALACFNNRHMRRYWKFISQINTLKRGLRKEKGFHIHHIVPKCAGGCDDHRNLIKLTYKEHVFAHLLLAKGTLIPDLVCTYAFMKRNDYWWNHENSYILSERIKESKSGKSYSESIKLGWETWRNNGGNITERYDKVRATRRKNGSYKHTEETKEKISKSLLNTEKDRSPKTVTPSERTSKGWETRRRNEANMSEEELRLRVEKRTKACRENAKKCKGKKKTRRNLNQV